MRPGGATGGRHKDLMMLTYCRVFQSAQMEGFFSSPPLPSASLVQSLSRTLRGTLLSSPKDSCPPWIPRDDWKGTPLSDWASQHRSEIDACFAKREDWFRDYIADRDPSSKTKYADKDARNYRLLGFQPESTAMMVHEGLAQEFAVELLLR